MCIYIYLYIYLYTNTHTHIYIYIHVHIKACVNICRVVITYLLSILAKDVCGDRYVYKQVSSEVCQNIEMILNVNIPPPPPFEMLHMICQKY